MLDKMARDVIAGRLRKLYDEQPKGGIPDSIMRPLLALEKPATVPPREGRAA